MFKQVPIYKQITCLRQLFPNIGCVDKKIIEISRTSNNKKWFAIPRWEKIANNYGEALQKALDIIKKTRNEKFYNYRNNQLDSQYLRQRQRNLNMIEKLSNQQNDCDILLIPVQFNLQNNRLSTCYVHEYYQVSEFDLGSFQIACILLTHPEYLKSCNDNWIDCTGDEFNIGDAYGFSYTPYFFFDTKLNFGVGSIDFPNNKCMYASASINY